MTATAAAADPTDTTPAMIEAELLPSAAADVRLKLLERMEEPKPLEIEVTEGPVSPCALQLLVAARVMAERDGLSVTFGERASAALAGTSTKSEETGA